MLRIHSLLCFLVVSCCSAFAGDFEQRIILLGDAGLSSLSPLEPSLQVAVDLAKQAPEKSKVLFLGDNIYGKGFPVLKKGKTAFTEKQVQQISYLTAQLQVSKQSGSEIYILPGNHDWVPKQVDDQAAYISQYVQQNQIQAKFVPYRKGQTPLPSVKHLPGVSLIFIDSTWMLHASGENLSASIEKVQQLINDINQHQPNNVVLLASHHPINSIGPHGNYGDLASCFTEQKCRHMRLGEVAHPLTQQAIVALKKAVAGRDKVIFAAGHDHSLQVFNFENNGAKQVSLVSGAANKKKISKIGDTTKTAFALADVGLMAIDIYSNKIVLNVYTIKQKAPIFHQILWQKN